MIDDIVVEAMDALIEMCSNRQQELGMCSIREMLCDLDADEFPRMSEDEKEECWSSFSPARRGGIRNERIRRNEETPSGGGQRASDVLGVF